jgi:hypothetical protein
MAKKHPATSVVQCRNTNGNASFRKTNADTSSLWIRLGHISRRRPLTENDFKDESQSINRD